MKKIISSFLERLLRNSFVPKKEFLSIYQENNLNKDNIKIYQNLCNTYKTALEKAVSDRELYKKTLDIIAYDTVRHNRFLSEDRTKNMLAYGYQDIARKGLSGIEQSFEHENKPNKPIAYDPSKIGHITHL